MNIKQKLLVSLALPAALVGAVALTALPVQADCGRDSSGEPIKTSILNCKTTTDNKKAENSAVWELLLIVLNIITAAVGFLAVGGIVYGSILFASAGDKAEQVKKSVGIIKGTLVGILAYGLGYILLNYLVPGGVFK